MAENVLKQGSIPAARLLQGPCGINRLLEWRSGGRGPDKAISGPASGGFQAFGGLPFN
jgi:hypothetical protein